MTVQLLKGHFEVSDARSLITQMIHVKIKFLEGKITGDSSEEAIKMRETRIKQLQTELYNIQKMLDHKAGMVSLEGLIEVE
jgi:hypothetical protein